MGRIIYIKKDKIKSFHANSIILKIYALLSKFKNLIQHTCFLRKKGSIINEILKSFNIDADFIRKTGIGEKLNHCSSDEIKIVTKFRILLFDNTKVNIVNLYKVFLFL
jgi:hypothetical protein